MDRISAAGALPRLSPVRGACGPLVCLSGLLGSFQHTLDPPNLLILWLSRDLLSDLGMRFS